MAENSKIYYGSGISVAGNIDIGALGLPADSRVMVKDRTGLTELQNAKRVYDGMLVYCESDQTYHKCRVVWDEAFNITSCTWTEVAIKSEEELVNLITSSTTAAMEFKGATAVLPASGIKGDMYKVTAEIVVDAANDAQGSGFTAKSGDSIVYEADDKWFLIPSGDDIEDTWRPITVGDAALGGVGEGKAANFAAGSLIDVTLEDNTITYSHEAVAAPENTNSEGDTKVREYITSVETDGHGHITGFKTNIETVADTSYEFEGTTTDSNVSFSIQKKVDGEDVDAAEVIKLDAYTQKEVDDKLATKLDANGWVNNDEGNGWEIENDGYTSQISKNHIIIAGEYEENVPASSTITPTAISISVDDGFSGQTVTYTSESIDVYKHGPDDEGEDVSSSTSIIIPTKSGTFALTSDIDTAVEALEDKIDSIDYSSFKTKQDEYSVAGDSKKTVTGVTQNANGEVEVTFGDIDFSHDHDDQYKKLQEQVEFSVEDNNKFITSIIQNENGEIISASLTSVDFTEVNEAIDKKLDAGNWKNIDDKLTIFNLETNSDLELAIDRVGIYDGQDYSSTYITAGSVSLMVAGDTTTEYKVGSIKHSFEDPAGENTYDATLVLPKKSGTFALTSDVDTALQAAKDYADAKSHENTTYEFAATENALEFTVTPSEGEAQTVTLVAPTVDTGVMEVTAGTDIVVTPGENGTVEVAHKEYQTGTVKDASHDSTTDPSFITGITIENGHVTGATVQNLAAILANMEFILDGGKSTT